MSDAATAGSPAPGDVSRLPRNLPFTTFQREVGPAVAAFLCQEPGCTRGAVRWDDRFVLVCEVHDGRNR